MPVKMSCVRDRRVLRGDLMSGPDSSSTPFQPSLSATSANGQTNHVGGSVPDRGSGRPSSDVALGRSALKLLFAISGPRADALH